MSAEAKVGLLVIVVVLLALGIAVFFSGVLQRLGTYRITIYFKDVQGLDPAARVRLGGVTIGSVEEVKIESHPDFPGKPVAVVCRIKPDTILYQSDQFMIRQSALVGDKYVAIDRPEKVPGGTRKRLADGARVAGGGISSSEAVMDEARILIKTARSAIESIDSILGDAEMHKDIKNMVANLRAATERVVLMSDKAIEIVDNATRASQLSEAQIAAVMSNLVQASEDIAQTTQRIQEMIKLTPVPAQLATAGENIVRASDDLAALAASARERVESSTVDQDIEAILADLRETSANIRELSASTAELAADEQLADDIRTAVANVREATESLKAAAASAESLLGDEQLNEDLQATISALRETAEASTGTIARADRVMTDIEQTMETVRNTQEIITQVDTRAQVQFLQARDGDFRADAALDIRPRPHQPRAWRLGLRDVGGMDRLDLQYVEGRGSDYLRAGLFGGDLGVAYQWNPWEHVGLEGELYDPKSPQLDLRLRFDLFDDYSLLLGLDRTFDDNDPMFGFRYTSRY